MGANFAAQRRLFSSAGSFDEILGGGGALWSSQDYDMAYRTYQSGNVILLRPEVTLRHDGRREAEDWPSLLVAYGSGDGAFYMKHIRCLDPFALWLFTKQFTGRPPAGWPRRSCAVRTTTTTTSRAWSGGREEASSSGSTAPPACTWRSDHGRLA